MFDVAVKSTSSATIVITAIEVNIMNGTSAQVWTKNGSYIGFETRRRKWTKITGKTTNQRFNDHCLSNLTPCFVHYYTSEFSFSGVGWITIPLTQGVTINAGLKQALYVSMSSTSNNNTYLKYGANYTTDDAFNSVVVEDTNLVVYPGAATKSLFGGEYLTPRYFTGAIEYNILNSSKDKAYTTNIPTKYPTRRPRRRHIGYPTRRPRRRQSHFFGQ